jgi:hypothetical protein
MHIGYHPTNRWQVVLAKKQNDLEFFGVIHIKEWYEKDFFRFSFYDLINIICDADELGKLSKGGWRVLLFPEQDH